MSECNHEFIGILNGVRCKKCGVFLSLADYRKECNSQINNKNSSNENTPKPRGRKKVTKDE